MLACTRGPSFEHPTSASLRSAGRKPQCITQYTRMGLPVFFRAQYPIDLISVTNTMHFFAMTENSEF